MNLLNRMWANIQADGVAIVPTIFALIIVAISVTSYPAQGAALFTVAVKQAEPFAYQEDGVWKGVSIDLLDRIKGPLGFDVQYIEVPSVAKLIGKVVDKNAHLAIGAISITPDREDLIDFSHPYFQTTQGILTHSSGSYVWFVAKKILIAVAILLTVAVVFGFIISRANHDDDIKTTGDGTWFTFVTTTTTGFGDMVPKGPIGKTLAVILMLSSMFLMPVFTAHITSALTVEKLTSDPTSLQDLYNTSVVTVQGSASSRMLDLLGIKYQAVETLKAAVKLVESGKVSAAVYDKALLDFCAGKSDNTLSVWGMPQGQEQYGIVFPQGSSLREAANVEMLRVLQTSDWKATLAGYFGQ